ncbi:MAG: YhcH/YjgK/YiaL family protein [Kiritimatiellae bacterium]|nr:YhcH/YjgK/YiaL family protein [Kiritimatiellia bacterium]
MWQCGCTRREAWVILDQLSCAALYWDAHPGFRQAFRFLMETNLSELSAGRLEVVPYLLYANVDHVEGRGRAGAVLEVHRKFVDIQFTLSGEEEIGWRDFSTCREWQSAFDSARDIGFLRDAPLCWSRLPPGYFAVYFPSDAHAPLAGTGPLRKVVMKVAADWPHGRRES